MREPKLAQQVEAQQRRQHHPQHDVHVAVEQVPVVGQVGGAQEFQGQHQLHKTQHHLHRVQPAARAGQAFEPRREDSEQREWQRKRQREAKHAHNGRDALAPRRQTQDAAHDGRGARKRNHHQRQSHEKDACPAAPVGLRVHAVHYLVRQRDFKQPQKRQPKHDKYGKEQQVRQPVGGNQVGPVFAQQRRHQHPNQHVNADDAGPVHQGFENAALPAVVAAGKERHRHRHHREHARRDQRRQAKRKGQQSEAPEAPGLAHWVGRARGHRHGRSGCHGRARGRAGGSRAGRHGSGRQLSCRIVGHDGHRCDCLTFGRRGGQRRLRQRGCRGRFGRHGSGRWRGTCRAGPSHYARYGNGSEAQRFAAGHAAAVYRGAALVVGGGTDGERAGLQHPDALAQLPGFLPESHLAFEHLVLLVVRLDALQLAHQGVGRAGLEGQREYHGPYFVAEVGGVEVPLVVDAGVDYQLQLVADLGRGPAQGRAQVRGGKNLGRGRTAQAQQDNQQP